MSRFSFLDLFSGGGGMTFGFHAHPAFEVKAGFDAEYGKPSSKKGSLGCNETYALNMGRAATVLDLADVTRAQIEAIGVEMLGGRRLDVLSACPPCTGFSRTNPNNHVADDDRNNHVTKVGLWVDVLRPRILMMENARELLCGNFSHHFSVLRRDLERLGYDVKASVHMLNAFGLPQRRERALIIATRESIGTRDLNDLWSGFEVRTGAMTVRRAIAKLPSVEAGAGNKDDIHHVAPSMRTHSLARIRAIPSDGGSWADLRYHAAVEVLMTPAMKRYVARGKLGSHPDVYGRMAWGAPSVTIKRECAHVGNGRYAHPEQDRLCTVREMGILQGFPRDYRFGGRSISNMYRHIGDAVPPLISFQLAHLASWMLTGERPNIRACILPNTQLLADDIMEVSNLEQLQLFGGGG